MGGLTFLSPFYLLGLLLPVVPIAIHLWSKHRQREVEFSDIRFIKAALAERERSLKLEDRRLLLLRIFLLAIFALALAKPVLRLGTTSVERGAASVVLVVDNSFSMGAVDNGIVRMDRAKERLKDILSVFEDGSDVTLIATSEHPLVILRRVDCRSRDPEREIERLKPSYYASNIASGLQSAISVLEQAKDKRKEIYLITDMQKSAWDGVEFNKNAVGSLGINLFIVDVGEANGSNAGLTGAEFGVSGVDRGGTMLESVFRAEHFGSLPSTGTWIRQVVNGEETSNVPLGFPQNGVAEQKFRSRIPEGEAVEGYAEIGEDALLVDNRYFFTYRTGGSTSILVVDGDAGGQEREGECFYFVNALKAISTEDGWTIHTESGSPRCERVSFSGFDLAVFLNVRSFGFASALALKEYVQGGGRALFFLGDGIDPNAFNETFGNEFFRFTIKGEYPIARPADNPAYIKETRLGHSMFSLFDKEDVDYGIAKFAKYWLLDFPEDAPVEYLAAFDNGDPAFVEAGFGSGKALVFASSAGNGWSLFPMHPVYVVWVGEIVGYLLDKTPNAVGYRVGSTIDLQVVDSRGGDDKVSVEVVKPDGTLSSVEGAFTEGICVCRFGETHDPGIYRFRPAGDDPATSVSPASEAVNVDSRESDLDTLSREQVEPLLSAFRTESFGKGSRFLGLLYRLRRGRPIWDYLLILMLVLALSETIYGNKVRRAK